MAGKRAVVTGGTAGMGLEIARGLLRAGIDTIVLGRRTDEAGVALAPDAVSARLTLLTTDFSRMAEVRRAAEEIAALGPLDILVNNAGAQFTTRQVTEDGFERTLAVNHLGAMLLTGLLFDRLRAAPAAHIVNVSSSIHQMAKIDFDDLMLERRYSVVKSYAMSKLANLLFTRELALKLQGTRVVANSFNPGGIRTGFNSFLEKWWMRPFTITPEQAAETGLFLATAKTIPGRSGGYFDRHQRLRAPSAYARRADVAARLWDVSDELLGHPWRAALATPVTATSGFA